MKNNRRFITMGLAFTFAVVAVTGIILRFFFKNHMVEETHVWIGLAMTAVGIVHTAQNWTCVKNYLHDPRVYVLLLPILLVMALFAFSPKEADNGMNPRLVVRKLAQAPAPDVARVFGKDIQSVLTSMKGDGLQVGTPNQTIDELAQLNQKRPEQLLLYFSR